MTLEDANRAALPGTGDIMLSASTTFGMAWHAARAGAWDLSAYYLRRTRSLFRRLANLKPKYEVQLGSFEAGCLDPLLAAAEARDRVAFEAHYEAAVELANRFHSDTGHAYIRWRTPPAPPDPGVALDG